MARKNISRGQHARKFQGAQRYGKKQINTPTYQVRGGIRL